MVSADSIMDSAGWILPSGTRGCWDDVFEERVFDWTAADAQACAHIMEIKRRRGEPLDRHLPDAMIAGTAVCHDLTIVTRNEREFRNTGAKAVNPWTVKK